MRNFTFFHTYHTRTWEASVRCGLVAERDGVRLCQSIPNPAELRFNSLATVGGALYEIIKSGGRPFYIDRLQGGTYIDDYVYDQDLLDAYRSMLGDRFLGFQMHEWLSNYRSDLAKAKEMPEGEWTEEQVVRFSVKNTLICLIYFGMHDAGGVCRGGQAA